MSTTKTIGERINALDVHGKFKKAIEGNYYYGKIISLAMKLQDAVGSVEHYADTMRAQPMSTALQVHFVVKQSVIVDELLEPMERILNGELKTEDFVLGRINSYEQQILNGHSTDLTNSNPSSNLVQFERHKVYCDILKVLKAK